MNPMTPDDRFLIIIIAQLVPNDQSREFLDWCEHSKRGQFMSIFQQMRNLLTAWEQMRYELVTREP